MSNNLKRSTPQSRNQPCDPQTPNKANRTAPRAGGRPRGTGSKQAIGLVSASVFEDPSLRKRSARALSSARLLAQRPAGAKEDRSGRVSPRRGLSPLWHHVCVLVWIVPHKSEGGRRLSVLRVGLTPIHTIIIQTGRFIHPSGRGRLPAAVLLPGGCHLALHRIARSVASASGRSIDRFHWIRSDQTGRRLTPCLSRAPQYQRAAGRAGLGVGICASK